MQVDRQLAEELAQAQAQCQQLEAEKAVLETQTVEQQQGFDAVREALEAQMRMLAGSIASQEMLIQQLQVQEAEAREENRRIVVGALSDLALIHTWASFLMLCRDLLGLCSNHTMLQ